MAEVSSVLDEDEFSCPICLELFKDPVGINCGHSYCMSCIKSCWDQEDHTGVYSCPQCRQTFTPRPVLGRNTILAEMVEKLKETGLQAATSADHYAGPGDVECDVCTGRKHKAVKSCLVCLASYCETDLQLHNKLHHVKQHELIDATSHLKDKVCSHHDKPLEVYCRTDQQCICLPCTMSEHRGHDTVSAAAGRAEIQKQMGETQRKLQQRIQMREKELQELREAVGSITRSAQSAVEDNKRIFTEMIHSIEKRYSDVTKMIRDQEKAAVSQAEGDMERLKQEIYELKWRHSELEQLSHTEDHIHFLQMCRVLLVSPEAGFGPRISVSPRCSFENVKKVVSEPKDQLGNVCENKVTEIHHTATKDTVPPVIAPRTRAELLQCSDVRLVDGGSHCAGTAEVLLDGQWGTVCDHGWGTEDRAVVCRQMSCGDAAAAPRRAHLGRGTEKIWMHHVSGQGWESALQYCGHDGRGVHQYHDACGQDEDAGVICSDSCRLTLDPNTANRNLHLSEGNRVVTWKEETQSYPDHQQRFDLRYQVLCKEGLTGRCYWEVEWSGIVVSIGVAYKGINRKGRGYDSRLGYNDKSWCLSCSTSSHSFWHNNEETAVSAPPSPRIGVYLDHRAGTLSFYRVSDTVTILHRVQTTFTEPLYPGFLLWYGKAKLC